MKIQYLCVLVSLLIGNIAFPRAALSGDFDGSTGLLDSCIAAYGPSGVLQEENGRLQLYNVTLRLLSAELVFALEYAEFANTHTMQTCSGRFEANTYTDLIHVRNVHPESDDTYHIAMDALPGEPMRLQLREDRLNRVIAPQRFAAASLYSRSLNGDSLLVMQNGHVLFEDYVAPFTAQNAHFLASGTKSFSIALYALGAAEGIWSLDEQVADTITEWQGDSRREAITVEHLLSLSSGLRDSPEYSIGSVRDSDIYDLAINKSLQPYDPGTVFIYGSTNFYILAAMFERKTGLDPLDYLYNRLLRHLGMKEEHLALWVRDRNGKPQMAGGAYLDTQTWANYGQLILQQGWWKGQQILDADIVALGSTYQNDAFRPYGLTWWLNVDAEDTYQPSMDAVPADGLSKQGRIAPGTGTDMYMAAGLFKQRLYIIPSRNLVIVRFGVTALLPFNDEMLLNHILDALEQDNP
jgi:CubicO group peptidase (beta-lactamase class C family)